MSFTRNCFKLMFVLSVFLPHLKADMDICVKKGPCTCEFSNGTGFDLSATVKTSFYSAQIYEMQENGTKYKLYTYFYHPCFDVSLKVNSTNKQDSCGMPLSICRQTNTMEQVNTSNTYVMAGSIYEFMGTSNVTTFSDDGSSIIYNNGPSFTIVLLVCAQTDDQMRVYSIEDPSKIVLSFYSREACLKQIETIGRSFGSTLLIILFTCALFYIVLGVGTKMFLMGATGIEVIPNLTFWTDLPDLVKEGWKFALNGFKLPPRGPGPMSSPDPNSYDSI